MAPKVVVCLLCLILVPVLCDESCFKRSEAFLSKIGSEIGIMEKGISELSSFMKDVVWNSMQMEMRLRVMKMEMESYRQSSLAAISYDKAPGSILSSAAASSAASATASAAASAAAMTHPATVSSAGLSSNDPKASSTCNLAQMLRDQFQGNVVIEIKADPAAAGVAEEPATIVKDETTKIGDLTSCSETNKTGQYRLKLSANVSFDVLCDAEFDKGGWVVIQHRFNGSEDFYRNWTEYESGFGALNAEFWLGNEKIHLLTAEKAREIAFVMEDFENNKGIARYASFKIGNKTEKYKLKSVGTFSGNAGDSFLRNVGSMFSTHDSDNDSSSSHCAMLYAGGWWYDNCHLSNMNGVYMKGTTTVYAKSMCWSSFKGFHYSLKTSRIMVRY